MPDFPLTSTTSTFRLTLRCDLTAVRAAAAALRGFLTEQGCGEEDLLDCELALVEACNNAIQYASERARALPVLVEAGRTSTEVEIRVTDHTPGFDWPAQPMLPAPESEHGRGIYLIHSVMNDTAYFRGHGENTLVMRRKLSA